MKSIINKLLSYYREVDFYNDNGIIKIKHEHAYTTWESFEDDLFSVLESNIYDKEAICDFFKNRFTVNEKLFKELRVVSTSFGVEEISPKEYIEYIINTYSTMAGLKIKNPEVLDMVTLNESHKIGFIHDFNRLMNIRLSYFFAITKVLGIKENITIFNDHPLNIFFTEKVTIDNYKIILEFLEIGMIESRVALNYLALGELGYLRKSFDKSEFCRKLQIISTTYHDKELNTIINTFSKAYNRLISDTEKVESKIKFIQSLLVN